jgi:hypothetical protein
MVGGEWWASRSCRFAPWGRSSLTYWIRAWVVSTVTLDNVERGILPLLGLEVQPLGRPASTSCSGIEQIRLIKKEKKERAREIRRQRRRIFLRSVRRLLVAACVVPSSPIFVTLMKEAPSFSKSRFLQEPHVITTQKTPFFIVTAVKTSNLTLCLECLNICLDYVFRVYLKRVQNMHRTCFRICVYNVFVARFGICVSKKPTTAYLQLF